MYRVIHEEVRRLGGDVLACGGTSNHVHLLVKYGRTISFAKFMNHVKGTSSAFLNTNAAEIRGDSEKLFRWQNGYAVFSIGKNQAPSVIEYVENQKLHHEQTTVRLAWEPPDDLPDKPDGNH